MVTIASVLDTALNNAMSMHRGSNAVDLPATLRDGHALLTALEIDHVLVGGIAMFTYDPNPPNTSDTDFGSNASLEALQDLCRRPVDLERYGFSLNGGVERWADHRGRLRERVKQAIVTDDFVRLFHEPDKTELHVICFGTKLEAHDTTVRGVRLAVADLATMVRTKALSAVSPRRTPAKKHRDRSALFVLFGLNRDLTLDAFDNLPPAALDVVREAWEARDLHDADDWHSVKTDDT